MATERFEHNFPGYQILAQLGRGNARVLKARNQVTGELVAIKHFAFNTDADTLKRFQRESEIMKVLKHPNIVKIKEVRLEAPLPYIVMELIEGGDLRNLLKQQGTLDVSAVVALGIQLSRAFKLIHDNGITHRDVKPENIMFRVLPNDELHFLLTDFGIAKLREQSHTITGTSMMTYEYASPEQFEDPKSVTHATDYYSLGVVLYECLTGGVPFPLKDTGMVPFIQKVMNEPPPAILLSQGKFLPPTLDLLIKGLLAKTKQTRISEPDKVERILHRAISEEPGEKSVTAAAPEKINVVPGKDPENEKAAPVRTKKFDRTPSPLIKSLIVLGIISAAITMIFYVSKWKNNNDFATASPATDSSIVAMNMTSIDDTVTAVPPVETPAIHHKMVHPVKSPDTITTTIDYPDGKYVGQVVGDIKNGLGTFFWNDGDRYSGYFVNGEKEGKGTFYYKNRDQYIGDWKNGKKNGMGTLYTSELTYEGEFLDDYFDGFGELKASENRIVTNCPDCKTYKGYWKEDLKEGFGECYDKDGFLLYQGKFSDDQPVEEYPNVERNKK